MASRRQLDFFGKLKLTETQRYGSKGKLAFENQFAANKTYKRVRSFLDSKKKPYAGDPNQLSFQLILDKSIAKKEKKAKQEAAALKKKLNNPYHLDGRASVLPANSKSISQPRLNQANVPNAPLQFPPQLHLETGNFKSGKGFKDRTFYEGAKLNSQTQAATAKNILKRAKKIKKVSVKAVAVVGLGSIVTAGINRKINTPSKVPEGYKMVFGKLRRVNN
jgi:hypothetical protein